MRLKKRSDLPKLFVVLMLTLYPIQMAQAANLSLEFKDENDQPVTNVVAAVMPINKTAVTQQQKGIIDQRNNAFVPDVLAIRVNTLVYFPNSDNVRHHVYSLSPAKRFELRLYHGQTAEPVFFDQPGHVILGCNIHDSMVGYIYVLDADHFGLSDANGRLIINNIPAGDYKLQLQHPKLGVAPQDQKLTLNANQTHTQTIKLTGFTQVKKEDPGSLNNLFK